MTLRTRIALLTLLLVLGLTLPIVISENRLLRDHLNASQEDWIDTLVLAIAEGVANDTINGERLHARERLRRIVSNDTALAYIFVTDFEGHLFAHTFDDGFPRDLIERVRSYETLETIRLSTGQDEIDDVDARLIEGMEARLHIGVNQREINALIAKAQSQTLLNALVVTIVALGIALVIGNRISRPLQDLTRQILGLGDGKTNTKVEVRTSEPDIRKLTDAFNQNATKRLLAESELRESEARLQAVLDFSPALIYTKDTQGTYTVANRAFDELAGLASEEVIGKNVYDLFPPNVADALKKNELAARNGPIVVEETVEHKDNKQHTYLATIFPLIDVEGQLLGTGGISADITARKEAESQTLEAMQVAEAASNAKSDFLRSMSHELRTPLNAILGFAQILQSDSSNLLSTNQIEYIKHIMTGGDHLLALVNQVLDLAMIEADQLDLSFEDVNAADAVEECVNLMHPVAEQRKVVLVNELSRELTNQLRVDKLRFKQVMINLLSNAIKYNKDGGSVTLNGVTTANNFLRISVTDTGIGIPESEDENIFRMFHRLRAEPAELSAGAGIGLGVTKSLIEQMAGQMGFESQEGVGSTFWVELPISSKKEALN